MQSHTKLTNLIFILACFLIFASFCPAQNTTTSQQESASATQAGGNELSFPYIAEITNDNVNIRSGPSTNYYHCGKLNTGNKVKVVASKHSWSHIVPPAGSFSWISKQYVSIKPNNPRIGIVTGDSVRVYAGSNFLKPTNSTTVQLKLNKGDEVKLTGEEMDDYYKIVPPTGAYLWVFTQYTKPLRDISEIAEVVEPKVETKPNIPAAVIERAPTESEMLKKYYALVKQIEVERAKPMAQQNYAQLKKSLAELASNKNAGKAARYSKFSIKQIGCYELAFAVDEAVRFQDVQLQQILKRIEKARAAKLEQVPELGGFTAVGQFQTSRIYGLEEELKHYRIIDDTGQTVCYALPVGIASQLDLSELVGRKVGLVGTVEPHPQTKSALVRFTEMVELK